jgi:tetratricopeptide (TPR) repeat protein
MSKPMLVTLPFVLLLLDYWPLNRLDLDPSGGMGKKHELRSHGICWSRIPRLIVEKIPMIVLAVLSSSLTIIVQHKVGALKSFKIFPFSVRISNAIISYVAYLGKMVWPLNLAVFYPYPKQFSILTVVMCLLLLIAITVLVVMSVRRLPYLVTGWFWYLGTLVPVIGIVQVGIQSMADKYTYIPLIGIFVMIAWGIPELLDKWQFKKIALATLTGIVIPILIACSWMQVEYWKNDNMLYGHALNVTMNNELAHYNLACALMDQGDLDSAIKECAEALRISPNHAVAYNLMGQILKMKGDLSKAINYYSKAIQNAPTYAEAYNNLGVAFMYESRFSDAIKMFSKVLELEPGNVAADVNMGSCLKFQGRVNEAIHYLKKALQIRPDLLAAHYFLGEALFLQGKIDESIIQYKKIMQMDPDNKSADQILNKLLINKDRLEIFVASLNKDLDNNSRKIELYMKLGNMYLDGGDKLRAVENYKTILTIDPGNLLALNRLVSVYYSLGEYDKALESMKSVIKTRPESDELYYNIASIYAKQDKIDESMKWLKLSIEKGFHDWELIKRDPDLASMRNTAFINELIKNH